MNVTCPECRSTFRVDPAKVPAAGVRARCSVCGGIFPIAAEQRAERRATPAVAAPSVAPPAPRHEPPRHEPPRHEPPRGEPAASEPARDPSIWGSPAAVPAQRYGATPVPDVGSIPAVPAFTPPSPAAPVEAPPPVVASVTPPAGVETAPRRPVNPYLSNDPNQKARRLARALVSDLIAYHPQKREEGLRAGTLKQLFRDEIRKSWEEYVEQVGAPLAESTPHFQDALNDLLAGGRKVF